MNSWENTDKTLLEINFSSVENTAAAESATLENDFPTIPSESSSLFVPFVF